MKGEKQKGETKRVRGRIISRRGSNRRSEGGEKEKKRRIKKRS